MAEGEEESKSLVAELIADHAHPTIRKTIRSILGMRGGFSAGPGRYAEDADDLYGEVVLELLGRLRTLRTNEDAAAITDFRGFVRLLCYRVCSKQARKLDPGRHSISGRVRYQLTVNPDFAIWPDERDEWVCGLKKWRDEGRPIWTSRSSEAGDLFAFFRNALGSEDTARIKGVPDLVAALFEWADTPIELEDVIDLAAKFLGQTDPATLPGSLKRSQLESSDYIVDPRVDIATEIERRAHLDRVWTEVKGLPLRQRRALLLNLRDTLGQGAAALIPITGVASIKELADVLEMPSEELRGIWNDLPLDDATIASRLGLSRQQVINLRRAARERLQRRIKTLGAGG
ncbi:MAG TPA: hypothetical protein VI756_28180 [Blastocatellia bacterium]